MLFVPSQAGWQAVAVLVAVTVVAAGLARWWPAYREELTVDGQSRLLSLDGLRGLLCFAVLVHHAACTLQFLGNGGRWVEPRSYVYTLLGRTSVSLFFCITGFLFWGRVVRANGRLDWLDFARGRALRILPMYYVSAIAVVSIVTRQFVAIGATPGQIARSWLEMSAAGALRWSPVLTPHGAALPFTVNAGVHWSLGYEWAFYAALPLLGLLATGRRPVVLWAGWIAALAAGAIVGRSTFVTMFPIGMIAAHLVRRPAFVAEMRRSRYAPLVCAALVGIALLGLRAHADPKSALTHALLLVVFVPIACGNAIFGLLRLPALRLMGTISYGVYLIHGIVLYCARDALRPLSRGPDDPNVAFWLATCALGVLTLLVASVTYLAVERPFIRLEHRLRERRRRAKAIDGTTTTSTVTPAPIPEAVRG